MVDLDKNSPQATQANASRERYFQSMNNAGASPAGFGGVRTGSQPSALATNKVLRNTYLLLSATLVFSAAMAVMAMSMGVRPLNPLLSLLIAIGLLFGTQFTRNSALGLVMVFAFTGFMGFMLGPILSLYFAAGAGQAVFTALGATAAATIGLSAYAITTRKDFSFMGGFLMAGLIVVVVASLANLFLHLPMLTLAVSAVGALLFSAFILFDTSRIVNGGETNYISATVSLYLDIYNLFTSLLSLLGGRR